MNRRLELRSSQQSVHYYVPEEERQRRGHPDYFTELYPHMLLQDISVSIMPIGGRAQNKAFRVAVTPEDDRAEQLVAYAIGRNGHREELGAALSGFVAECAQLVMAFGAAHYELVYFFDDGSESPVEFTLTLIQPGSVKRRRGGFVQHIPASVAKKEGFPEYVWLPNERVLAFGLPNRLRGYVARAMDSLAVMSGKTLPPFVLEERLVESTTSPFDVEAYNRAHKVALAAATRRIGWNARGLLQGETLEYYWLYRFLVFERFKIELRTEILTVLNQGIERAGREMGFSVRLGVEGLPTLNDVAAALGALAAGQGSFKQITGPFMGY